MKRVTSIQSGSLNSMHQFARGIMNLTGWRRPLVALVAGALSVLAMAPFHLWPVIFVTFPILVWLIDGADAAGQPSDAGPAALGAVADKPPRHQSLPTGATPIRANPVRAIVIRAALMGWWFGFGYFAAGLFWIGEAFLVEADKFAVLLPFAVTLMPAGLALFWAVACGLAALAWRPAISYPASWTRLLALALSLSFFEWLRGHIFTGFPWNLPGYALTYPLPLMQSAGVIGVYGLTLVAFVIFTFPLVLWNDRQAASATLHARQAGRQSTGAPSAGFAGTAALAAIAVVPLLVMFTYGRIKLSAPLPDPGSKATLRIVQPSIPQTEKWQPQFQLRNFEEHLALSRRNARGEIDNLAHIDLVVWPEAAMPFLPLRYPEVLAKIGDLLPDGTHLLTGALRAEDPRPTQIAPPVSPQSVPGDARLPPSARLRKSAMVPRDVRPSRDAPSPPQATPAPNPAPEGKPAPAARPGARSAPATRRKVFNSLLVLDHRGQLAATYDKTHLVPFGEYLPYQEVLEAIGLEQLSRMRGGFDEGAEPRPSLRIPGLPLIGPLICYEAIFPGVGRKAMERPEVLINVTNDGWFGNTTGPRQHLQQARVRAVEEGLPLIRSANNGVSAVIDPMGRILRKLELNDVGIIDTKIPAALSPPIYSRWGDSLFGLMWLFGIAILMRSLYRFGL